MRHKSKRPVRVIKEQLVCKTREWSRSGIVDRVIFIIKAAVSCHNIKQKSKQLLLLD